MTARLRKLWSEMTTVDFETAIDPERTVAILPVAAIEQHGPHLPVSVDTTISQGLVDAIIAAAPDDLPITFLPPQVIGKSNEHMAFPGTLSLSTNTLIGLWTDIAESVWASGIRKLVLLNSHGGQVQIMDIVARDMRVRRKMFVATASLWGVGLPKGLFPAEELSHGIHGGEVETSMMLYLRPDLVRQDQRANFAPRSLELEQTNRYLRFEGQGIGFGWQTQDLHPSGACGDALNADPERGRQLIVHATAGLIDLFREVSEYPLSAMIDR
jgi:creatinine amidohydrolase